MAAVQGTVCKGVPGLTPCALGLGLLLNGVILDARSVAWWQRGGGGPNSDAVIACNGSGAGAKLPAKDAYSISIRDNW